MRRKVSAHVDRGPSGGLSCPDPGKRTSIGISRIIIATKIQTSHVSKHLTIQIITYIIKLFSIRNQWITRAHFHFIVDPNQLCCDWGHTTRPGQPSLLTEDHSLTVLPASIPHFVFESSTALRLEQIMRYLNCVFQDKNNYLYLWINIECLIFF